MRKQPRLFPSAKIFARFFRAVLERQIAATDRQIARRVYQLYGVTDDDIVLVESAAK